MKLDLKNRKILYQLDVNSRQSYSQIGKWVGLPKSKVSDRIMHLQDEGIIKSFYTVIDAYKLGYLMMRFQYKYQYVTPNTQKDIIDYFVKDKTTTLVASTQGTYNLKVVKIIKDINKFYNSWRATQRKYGNYFQEKSSALFLNEMYYRPSYLLTNNHDVKEREKVILIGRGRHITIDPLDTSLLRLISLDARIPLTQLAEKLNCSIDEANQRLSNLQKRGIIRGFRADLDIMKLGYHIFRVCLFLNDYSQRHNIIEFIGKHPHLVFIDTYTGEADLEIEFHLDNMNHFTSLMQDLSNKFPTAISHYQYLNVVKYHKFLYLPKE